MPRAHRAAVAASATRAYAADIHFKGEDIAIMRKDVLALICPDWRLASLVMDGRNGQISYANTPCLRMLADRRTVHQVGGRIAFASAKLTEKFYTTIQRMLANGLENAALVERDARDGALISIMIRNTQGFFRDALARSMGRGEESLQFVVVEMATSADQSDWTALHAFAQAFALPPAEVEIAELAVRGLSLKEMAMLKGVAIARMRQSMNKVLAKTRCRHQAELVRLVMTLCPLTRRA